MWVVIISILIVFEIGLVFCRLIWAISKPIFVYLYQRIIKELMKNGMTEQAAKAIISGIAILFILLTLFSSY